STPSSVLSFFFLNAAATTAIYTLSLHDALPIYRARKAAIHLEHCAGNIAGPFRRKKRYRGSQFVRRADPVHGDLRQSLLHHLGASPGELLDSLGRNETRADAVDGDPIHRDFVRQRFGETE